MLESIIERTHNILMIAIVAMRFRHVQNKLQSLALVLPLCMGLFLTRNAETLLVESWSPTNLPFFSTSRYPTIERRKFKRKLQSDFSSGRPRLSTAFAANADVDNAKDEAPEFIEVESLSASQVTELIELSFFQACYALSKGDKEPLRLFVVAVTTAAVKKYPGASANALTEIVDGLPPSARPLEPQERELRATWIRAIYLVMEHVLDDFDSSGSDSSDEVAATYGPVLIDLVAIHQAGMGLNVRQFVASRKDILLPEAASKANPLALEDDGDEDSLQLAVVTQTINVLFATLSVLEEDDADTSGETIEPTPTSSVKKKNKKKTGKSGNKGFG